MKDRLYDLAVDIQDESLLRLARQIGVTIKLGGLIFLGDKGGDVFVYFDDVSDMVMERGSTLFPTPKELAAILRQSDDPIIYRDNKPWQRKAQYQLSGQVQQQIWARDEFRCMVSGKYMGDVTLSIDHWIPLEAGGKNDETNYISMSRQWNKRKGGMMPQEFCEMYNLDYVGLCRWIEVRNSGHTAMLPEHLR